MLNVNKAVFVYNKTSMRYLNAAFVVWPCPCVSVWFGGLSYTVIHLVH